MNEFIGNGTESPQEILELLRNNADGTEKMKYVEPFSDEDLAKTKEVYFEKAREYDKLDDSKKKIVKELDAQMKPLKIEVKGLLKEISDEGEARDEDVFYFVDQDAKEIGYYTPSGRLIYSRKAKRSELKQPGIFNMPRAEQVVIRPSQVEKTGTDDVDLSFPSETE